MNTTTPYVVLPLFAIRFAACTVGIWISFIKVYPKIDINRDMKTIFLCLWYKIVRTGYLAYLSEIYEYFSVYTMSMRKSLYGGGQSMDRIYNWQRHGCGLYIPVKLRWIFLGAHWKSMGLPGNIQGNLTGILVHRIRVNQRSPAAEFLVLMNSFAPGDVLWFKMCKI